jgi:hypothetical protein
LEVLRKDDGKMEGLQDQAAMMMGVAFRLHVVVAADVVAGKLASLTAAAAVGLGQVSTEGQCVVPVAVVVVTILASDEMERHR